MGYNKMNQFHSLSYNEACDFVRFHLRVISKQNVNFSFNIQHLALDNDCCISRDIGRTKINLVTSNNLYFLYTNFLRSPFSASGLQLY